MKILKILVEKDGTGQVDLIPDESEDMWHAYNLIVRGDRVKTKTIRRVAKESYTGSSESERVQIMVTLEVLHVEYDAANSMLRINGKNVAENKYIKLGAHHSLDINLNCKFSIQKDFWDSVSLDRVKMAGDPASRADVGAVIISEGLANICLVTGSMTIVRAKIECSVPRKRRGGVDGHEKAMTKFFDLILQGILKHINFDKIKCLIIASPGFTKDQFLEYLWNEVQNKNIKILQENKAKFLPVHSSSGHKYALKEILSDPVVAPKLLNTKALGEVQALQQFYDTLKSDADRAVYGFKQVQSACEQQAIDVLLITDKLFRSSEVSRRKACVQLVEDVAHTNGTVKIFSSLHVSGEQLDQLTGVAAILRFPIPEIAEIEDEAADPEVVESDDGSADNRSEEEKDDGKEEKGKEKVKDRFDDFDDDPITI